MAGDERVDEPMFMMIASRNLKNWGRASALVKKSAKLPTVETNGTRKEWATAQSITFAHADYPPVVDIVSKHCRAEPSRLWLVS